MAKLAKKTPRHGHLKKGEIWVMADTGSTLHGIDVAKHVPGYKRLVRKCHPKRRGKAAETACGGSVTIDGEIDLTGYIGDDVHTIPFNDMKVSMPIASMRKTIKAGNDLHITLEGGYIENRQSGRRILLHERCGVYFFKLQLLPPHLQEQENRKSGFARQA